MPSTFLDRVIFLAASAGTGSFVQASAVAGFQTIGAAGGVNGQTYPYAAQSADLSQWEVGHGVWTSGTSTLTRVVLFNSLGTTAAINFTLAPNVMITINAEDSLPIDTSILYAGSGVLSLGVTGVFRAYNSVDSLSSPTNYERGTFDWTTTSNVLTIGAQKGGTGTLRDVAVVGANVNLLAAGGASVIVNTGGSNQVNLNNNGVALLSGTQGFVWSGPGNPQLLNANTGDPVLQIGSGGGTSTGGWINWNGEARLDADFSATSNTALANVTGSSNNLSISLRAGRKYIFEIILLLATGSSLGGIKVGLGGTATVTNLIADGDCIDGTTIISVTRVSTLTQMIANTNAGTTPKAFIWGEFECNAAGTFTVQFAQNASNATASTVKRGSYMLVQDSP